MSSASNKGECSRSNSTRSKHSARILNQTSADAKLNAEFEESDRPFDYSTSVGAANLSKDCDNSSLPLSTVSDYLRRIQRGRLIQPFGCLLAVEETTFAVIAYSENAAEMLDLVPHAVPSMEQKEVLTIGMDARTFFRPPSAVALQKACSFADVSLLNPVLVHCRNSGKPFYAIINRTEEGLVIDLEPVNPSDVPVTAAGALKSYKLAAKAISKLQSIPSGNIPFLCDVLVREVSELTGYDRVMAYKFHEDEHGEVIAECRSSDLEPYLGLHYPATDIPQASRFLFKKNKVRMICDCYANPVEVIQDERMVHPLSLCSSTLRAPHGCHSQYMANMGSIASLVMSVTINEDDTDYDDQQTKEQKLWGLVVCHHASPKFVPFPLRYACEFLLQVFGIQLNKEVELAAQARERHILQTQSVLCDMLLRDAPAGIFTQSPNVMDLVKCDGAALYYKDRFWLLGVTPTEAQMMDIAFWLLNCHDSTTGLSTDSLLEAGFPGAPELGDSICGMAAIKITNKDFVFWFRSHAAKEIKWGGAKNDHVEREEDGRKMHPRSSFKAFLEVVKQRSLPWDDVEMDAIHSLQLILRGSLHNTAEKDDTKSQVNTPNEDVKKIQAMDELQIVTNEMVRLIETATVPIFAVDETGNVNGWNTKAAELTGLSVHQAIGVPLISLIHNDSIEVVKKLLSLALQGKEEKNVEFKLKRIGFQENDAPVVLVVNACCSRDVKDSVVGVCFVAQNVTGQKMLMDKYARIQGDYVATVRNPMDLIPPIFIVNEIGVCIEWNAAMQKVTGLRREDALGKLLVGEVFSYQNFGCKVKDFDMLTKLNILLNTIISGQESEKLLFGFYGPNAKYVKVLLSANKRKNSDGKITGAFFFLHTPSPELQHALKVQKMSERAAVNSFRELSYMRQELRNPLNGIILTQNLIATTDLSLEQRNILRSSTLCQEQLTKILEDATLEQIEESCMEMAMSEFNLGEVLEAVMIQATALSKERNIPVSHDFPKEISSLYLLGDNLRLQQVLSDFLLNSLQFTESSQGPVVLRTILREELVGTSLQIVHVEFRIVHPAPGIPDALIQEMFHHKQDNSREGLGLHISQKLVTIMNGSVQYVKEAESSSFIIVVEFPLARCARKRLKVFHTQSHTYK